MTEISSLYNSSGMDVIKEVDHILIDLSMISRNSKASFLPQQELVIVSSLVFVMFLSFYLLLPCRRLVQCNLNFIIGDCS